VVPAQEEGVGTTAQQFASVTELKAIIMSVWHHNMDKELLEKLVNVNARSSSSGHQGQWWPN